MELRERQLERLIDRTWITFPRFVHVREIRDILTLVALNAGCEIRYSVGRETYVHGDREEQGRLTKTRTTNVSGNIYLGDDMCSLGFSFRTEGIGRTGFKHFSFNIFPAETIHHMTPAELELIDKIRAEFGRYFAQNKS